MKPSKLILQMGLNNPKIIKKVRVNSTNQYHNLLNNRIFDVSDAHSGAIAIKVDENTMAALGYGRGVGNMPETVNILMSECSLIEFDSNELVKELIPMSETIKLIGNLLTEDDKLDVSSLDAVVYLEKLNSCKNDVERLKVLSELC